MPVQLVTVSEYARRRGCDEKAVRKAIEADRITTIERDGKRLIDPAVADIQWAKNTRARADSAPPPPPSEPAVGVLPPSPAEEGEYSVNRARRERYEADLAQMKLLEQQGDLVRVVEVRAEISRRVGQLKSNLLQIPARLAHLLEPEARAALEVELRQVLTNVTEG
jgi:hypothetical protein